MKNAPQIIKEVYEITDKAWLFGATLLGAIREGKIVAWDKDVDLGFPSEEMNADLIAKFKKAGFQVEYTYQFNLPEMAEYLEEVSGYGKVILKKQKVKVEICCFKKGKDGRYYYASGTPRFFVLEADMVDPLVKHSFYDFEVNVPKNAEKQLVFVYGEDWRTPIKDWYFTPAHYKCRERTIIELREDDGSRWSKWTGRKVINANSLHNRSI